MKDIIINSVPCTTWNWLKMNKDSVSLEVKLTEKLPSVSNMTDNITISTEKPENLDLSLISSGICNIPNPKAKDNRRTDGTFLTKEEIKAGTETAAPHALAEFISSTVPTPQFITIKGKQEKPLILNFDYESPSVTSQLIYATENSESTIIFIYKGKAETSLIQTKIYAEENAKLHLVKVQLLDEGDMQLDDTGIFCADNANVHFTQIELGGLHIDSGLNVNLNGYKANFKSNVAYYCKNNQYLDMNHIVNHFGKKTECDMQVNGTLKDESGKTYRGTIDFKNGCCGSKGNEMEESLVLSPKVINKSLPNILCDEEDVEGEHGATIGRLSSDILFYMQSRGISVTEAEKLMARAKIQAACDMIPDEETKTLISDYLDSNNL